MNQRGHFYRASKRGFTLIEVLVVMALLSVLAAILFPTFAQVREKARQTTCASNLRQIGLAVMLYKTDYDEAYPYAVSRWAQLHPETFITYSFYPDLPYLPLLHDLLEPYSKSKHIFGCPSDTGNPWSDPPILPSKFQFLGMSYTFDMGLALGGHTDSEIPDLSQHFYAGDQTSEWHNYRNSPYSDRRGNELFLDGHVRFTFASTRGESYFAY